MWNTRVTRQLGIELPFVGAGMAIVGCPALTAAVSNAGGIGLLSMGPAEPALLARAIGETRRLTDRPFGVDFIVENTAFGPTTTEAHLDIAIAERIPLCVFFWTLPPAAWVERLHAARASVWATAWSAASARDLERLGVDAIIAQSCDAGGHTRASSSTLTLVPALVDCVPRIPVVAAGGIVDGRTAAAAFALGAEAVCVGTRLVASSESIASPEYKNRILAASHEDTTITKLFGPEWPDAPTRVIRNRAVARAERGEALPAEPIGQTHVFGMPYAMPPASAILPSVETRGDHDEMCLAAGAGVAGIRSILPAGEIVAGIMRDACRRLAPPV
jgi:NAD(P)H-dependent flavin oxidoreductase YrpB (nitropropane dioxygenase family)